MPCSWRRRKGIESGPIGLRSSICLSLQPSGREGKSLRQLYIFSIFLVKFSICF